MDRRDRIRFLVSEREAAPWREKLARVLATFPDAPQLETPPTAEPGIQSILRAWEQVRQTVPDRRTFTEVGAAAEHLAAVAGAAGDEVWILPGPKPNIGVLRLTAPLSPELIAALTTWNEEGFLLLNPDIGEIQLVDLLQTEPPIVEVQSGRVSHPEACGPADPDRRHRLGME